MTETPALPEMKPVTSSNIESIGHNGTDLFVKFKGGGTYRYPGVSVDHHDKMLEAGSPGGYFHANIKKVHKGEKLPEKKDA